MSVVSTVALAIRLNFLCRYFKSDECDILLLLYVEGGTVVVGVDDANEVDDIVGFRAAVATGGGGVNVFTAIVVDDWYCRLFFVWWLLLLWVNNLLSNILLICGLDFKSSIACDPPPGSSKSKKKTIHVIEYSNLYFY